MPLNPITDAIRRADVLSDSPFQAEAHAALAGFRTLRSDLERQVRTGRLTPRTAREQAAQAAAALRDDLVRRAAAFRSEPDALAASLARTLDERRRETARPSVETLQREANQLLRQTLVEQQLATRAAEFQARTFVRSLAGGPPAPSLEALLALHAQAEAAADEPAREWARRQLEALRPHVHTDADLQRLDLACERPDQVNPRSVARYLEVLAQASPAELERFTAEAVQSRDASAAAAAFLLARRQPAADAPPAWVQTLIESLGLLPDAALNTLQVWESQARQAEIEAAQAAATAAATRAEVEVRMPTLVPPTDAQLARLSRDSARPIARPDQPIGLAPRFRGAIAEESSENPAEFPGAGS